MKTADGKIIVIAGRSRSGKTAWTAKRVKAAQRVCAWDPEAQWCDLPGWRKVTTRAELKAALLTRGRFRVAYVAGGDLKSAFDFWAAVVMYAGRYFGKLDAVAEELADVTTPSKAPGSWGILLRRGLKRGISIYCISQRWAEADKTALGNASMYACFAMRPRDSRYMATATGVNQSMIDALIPEYWDDEQEHAKRLPFMIMQADGTVKHDDMRFPEPKNL